MANSKKFITGKSEIEKEILNHMKTTCDKALDFCLKNGATEIEDFAAAVATISPDNGPDIKVDVNQNGLTLSLKDYPSAGTTTGKFMMKYLGYDEEAQSQFTTKGIKKALGSDSENDALLSELNKTKSRQSSSTEEEKLMQELNIKKSRSTSSKNQIRDREGIKNSSDVKDSDADDAEGDTEDFKEPAKIEASEGIEDDEGIENTAPVSPKNLTASKKSNWYSSDNNNKNETKQNEDEREQKEDTNELLSAVQKHSAAAAQQGNEIDGTTIGGLTIQAGTLAAIIGDRAAKELLEAIKTGEDKKRLNSIVERYQKADARGQQLIKRISDFEQASSDSPDSPDSPESSMSSNQDESFEDDEDINDLESSEQPLPDVIVGSGEFNDDEQIVGDDENTNDLESSAPSPSEIDSHSGPLPDNSQDSTATEKLAEAIDKTSSKLEKTGLLAVNDDSPSTIIDTNADISEQLSQIEKALERLEKRLDALSERVSALETAQKNQESSQARDENEINKDDKAAEFAFLLSREELSEIQMTDSQGKKINFSNFTEPSTSLTTILGESEEGDVVFEAEATPENISIKENQLNGDDLKTMTKQATDYLSSQEKQHKETTKAAKKTKEMEL